MAARRTNPADIIRQLQATSPPRPQSLYVVMGDEILLVNESLDALRHIATQAGYTERISLRLDARSDWSELLAAIQNASLFGEDRLVVANLPSGRPGRTGGDVLQQLSALAEGKQLGGSMVIVCLPALDRATRNAKWAKALLASATVLDVPAISRQRLPEWISQRLAAQDQHTHRDNLVWMADQVEGNLLAAHQEIQKLALLYPAGELSADNVQAAVLNVARYNVFALRDAMLAGDPSRTLTILEGLRAEGEAPPLVLWAIGDEIRVLARLAVAHGQGQLDGAFRHHRVFGPRQSLVRRALDRVAPHQWPAAVHHAHEVDRLIKGLPPKGRLTDPWAELARLALRVSGQPAVPARP